MAALQKVRNHGKMLVAIIGLALFGFLIEEGVKACASSHENPQDETVIAYGDTKLSRSEYQSEYNNFKQFAQMLGFNGNEDEMHAQFEQDFQQQALIMNECNKLGLVIGKEELDDLVNNPYKSRMLSQPLQGGTTMGQLIQNFASALQNPQVAASMQPEDKAFYEYLVKRVKFDALSTKYYNIMASTIVSNPVAAKANFDDANSQSTISLVAMPYETINDNDVKVEDSELAAKYEEMKEQFVNPAETRVVKYIDVKYVASASDVDSLKNELTRCANDLKTKKVSTVVTRAKSLVPYFNIPVTKDAFTQGAHEVAEMLDSMKVGEMVGPFEHDHDNTLNVVYLINKVEWPDTIKYSMITPKAFDMDKDEWNEKVDSMMARLQKGEVLDSVANDFDNTAVSNDSIFSASYQKSVSAEAAKDIKMLNTAAVGSCNILEQNGYKMIVKIREQSKPVSKFDVAVIKREKKFYEQTVKDTKEGLNKFLSENKELKDVVENAARNGYTVMTQEITTQTVALPSSNMQEGLYGINSLVAWAFDDAKAGDIYPKLAETSDNAHVLVIAVDQVNAKGYKTLEDETVNRAVKDAVIRDKKAEMLLKKMEGKTFEALASAADTCYTISAISKGMASVNGRNDNALSGAVSACKQGETKVGVRGDNAVYAFKVTEKKQSAGVTYNEQSQMQSLASMDRNRIGGLLDELYIQASKKDQITNVHYKDNKK